MCSIGFEKVSHKDASSRLWKSLPGRLIGTSHLTWTVALLARTVVPIQFPFLARWKTIWSHLKSFENIPRHSWNARKSQGDPQKSYEELGIFGGLQLSQFVSSLTADHYFWCFGGFPCCLEGVPGYYGMFQGCSRGVPGVSLGCSGVFRGCSGVFRVLQTPEMRSWIICSKTFDC